MNGDLDGSSWTLLAEFWVSTRMLLRSFAALINFFNIRRDLSFGLDKISKTAVIGFLTV